ncbi:hypothetical protein [Actinomadura sp. KC216]|uniref:hypothetical protein n=1 Tax=Actinomadura sp. KC216 TaxID=2530370 RepID=UPI001404D03B|nr:hypothetical protein [Actinomadura sp. KC216]
MAKQGAKGKKIGRNKVKCERYRAKGTREQNKERRRLKREGKLAVRKMLREAAERVDAA